MPCDSEEKATAIINECKKKYFDAKHNVYAYVLRNNNTARFSDDGEPHGTAGKPILDIINASGVSDVIIVVTRYFGGTLLGTGGLVRAYTASAKDALFDAGLCEMKPCVCAKTVCGYSDYNILLPLLRKFDCEITNTVFEHETEVFYSIDAEKIDKFRDELTEKFAAKLVCESVCENFFKKRL